MANALDLLLGGKIDAQRPTKEVKIKRLSNDEVDFILTATAITMEDFRHVQEMNKKGKELDEVGANLMILCYGIKEFDERSAENKDRIKNSKRCTACLAWRNSSTSCCCPARSQPWLWKSPTCLDLMRIWLKI